MGYKNKRNAQLASRQKQQLNNNKRKQKHHLTTDNSNSNTTTAKNTKTTSANSIDTNKSSILTTREEQHEIEAEAKYSRLVDIATKSIRKEAKVVKSFECQKIVRKIKLLTKDLDDNEKGDAGADDTAAKDMTKTRRKVNTLEERLKITKEFNLDDLIHVSLKRLGLKKHPNHDGSKTKKETTNDTHGDVDGEGKEETDGSKNDERTDIHNKTETISNIHSTLIESMLQHKRLAPVIQSMNEKTTEYYTWKSRREEWLLGKKNQEMTSNDTGGGGNTQKRKRRHKDVGGFDGEEDGEEEEVDVLGHDGTSGLFIDSLAGAAGVLEENDDNANGNNYNDFDSASVMKKNRPGQRARKAKAMAIQANKAGQAWDNSINWREKKKSRSNDDNGKVEEQKQIKISASGLDKSKGVKVAEVTEMGKNWKEEGKAHPSWAAREAQKSKSGLGIVEFTGKKITFD